MKTVLILSITTLFFSCGTQKEVANNQADNVETPTPVPDPAQNVRIIGTVHLDEGCGVHILAKVSPDEVKTMYPVNLEDQYKVEGARIKFEYALSRAPMPEGCEAEMTVTVSDVTRTRE